MKKVVGLGACVYDTLINCDKFPTEDTKQKAESVFVSGGGPVGNALVVMSKLGLECSVTGAFADDNAGKYILADFEKYGVKTAAATVINGASSFTSHIILSAEKKTRTILFERGSVPDEPKNVDFSEIENADILHLDGNYISCAVEAAKHARKLGVKVSLDAGGLYKDIEKLLPYTDILIPSMEFARGITGETEIAKIFACLQKGYNPEILVVTDGSNGGYYYNNGKVNHYGSIKVKEVDTNGAGDTFHGAFLVAYADGKEVKECCEFANKVAAYKCTRFGTRTYKLNREIISEL